MDKPITEMTPKELNAMIDRHHEQQGRKNGQPPPSLFYNSKKDIFGLKKVEETIPLRAQIVDSQLQLHLPMQEARNDVEVHDNQIIMDNLRVVIHLVSSESATGSHW